jgi:histidinol-phosphate/aromatic aminotransferase/cobyric acid decarboxylase-like protein
MHQLLAAVPQQTKLWIDETYIDYVGANNSLEIEATNLYNVIICKSMSKAYSLSGARVAYLCASPHIISTLKTITPPWVVSLPAQVAAVTALQDVNYYQSKYDETRLLRQQLKADLFTLGIEEIIEGCANFLLFYLPPYFPSVADFISRCRANNLFVRDVSNMGKALGEGAVRIAVKDEMTNKKMIQIIKSVVAKQQKLVV